MKQVLLFVAAIAAIVVCVNAQQFGGSSNLTFQSTSKMFVEESIRVVPLNRDDLKPQEAAQERMKRAEDDFVAEVNAFATKYGAIEPAGCAPYATIEIRGDFVVVTRYKANASCDPNGVHLNTYDRFQ